MSLADEIAADADDLQDAYPKGATLHDLAGYYGEPLSSIEKALGALRARGDPLLFLRAAEPVKDVAAQALGRKGAIARNARKAARERWSPTASREPWAPQQTHRVNHIAEHDGPHPNKRGRTQPERLADDLRYRLHELVAAHQLGATIKQFAKFFAIDTITHAREAIAILEAEATIIVAWTYDTPREKIIYVRGMRQTPPPLTATQERIFDEILRRAHGAPTTIVNYTDVAKAAGTAYGSAAQVCWALERKGYLKRLTPYDRDGGEAPFSGSTFNGMRSPEYEIRTPTLSDPFADALPPKRPQSVRPHPDIPAAIRDQGAVKRAVAKRADLVREIERIDAFLGTFGDLAE